MNTSNFHRIGDREMPELPLSDCFVAVVEGRVMVVDAFRQNLGNRIGGVLIRHRVLRGVFPGS